MKSNKLLFSNTFNFPESVINLHQSINRDISTNNFDKITSSTFANKISETYNTQFRDYNSFQSDMNSHRMYPSLVTPQLNRLSESTSQFELDKQIVNLEDLYLGEEKVWSILEAIRNRGSLNFSCEDYLEFVSMNSIQNIENYFQNNDAKILMNTKEILEITAGICLFISLLKNKLNDENMTHMKNLYFVVHQSFLILVDIVINRLPREFFNNIWVIKLNSIVKTKQIKSSESGENNFQLKQNNILILNSLVKYISKNFKNKLDLQIYDVLSDILENVEKYAFSTVKNIILNFVIIFNL